MLFPCDKSLDKEMDEIILTKWKRLTCKVTRKSSSCNSVFGYKIWLWAVSDETSYSNHQANTDINNVNM